MEVGEIPYNLILTASYGGLDDKIIGDYNLKSARVIRSRAEAGGMPIDTNDDLARMRGVSFCLLDNHKKAAV